MEDPSILNSVRELLLVFLKKHKHRSEFFILEGKGGFQLSTQPCGKSTPESKRKINLGLETVNLRLKTSVKSQNPTVLASISELSKTSSEFRVRSELFQIDEKILKRRLSEFLSKLL